MREHIPLNRKLEETKRVERDRNIRRWSLIAKHGMEKERARGGGGGVDMVCYDS